MPVPPAPLSVVGWRRDGTGGTSRVAPSVSHAAVAARMASTLTLDRYRLLHKQVRIVTGDIDRCRLRTEPSANYSDCKKPQSRLGYRESLTIRSVAIQPSQFPSSVNTVRSGDAASADTQGECSGSSASGGTAVGSVTSMSKIRRA